MKRALAERAKQSASIGGTTTNSSEPSTPAYHGAQQQPHTNSTVSSPAPVPSSLPVPHVKNSEIYHHPQSPSQPPKKIAKLDTTAPNHHDGGDASRSHEQQQPKPDAAPSSSSNSVPGASAPLPSSSSSSPVHPTLRPPAAFTSRSLSLGGAGHKRPREAPQADSSSSSSSTNAFYLQHQNRALAVELRSLQHSLRQLERERDQRRMDCSAAVQALHRLHATWTQLETALLPSTEAATPRNPTNDGRTAGSSESNHDGTEATGLPTPSTGAGDSVEWTVALSRALVALGKEEGSSDGQTDDSYDRIASSLAARASVLQDVLWKVLRQASNNTGGNHVNVMAAAAAASRTEIADQRSKVQEAMGEIRGLQAQVEELKASRDAAVASERKVRRNVYRLAANMINVDQLMAAIQDDTEVVDVELQQEIVKQQLLKQDQGTVPAGGPSNSSGDDGRHAGVAGNSADADALAKHAHASAATIDAMKTRITDLERTLSNRDDSIEQVRSLALHVVWSQHDSDASLCYRHSSQN
jgi:FtsZ-binding cell division protein ZapB